MNWDEVNMHETRADKGDDLGNLFDEERDAGIGELRLADGELFELPGVRGRLERIDFGNGTCLYRAELNVREDSRFDVQNSLPAGWLAGSVNLIGSLDLKCPNGRDHSMSSEIGLMMRIDPVGTRYLLPGGQLIRHAGVSIELDALKVRFGDVLPDALDRFFIGRPGNDRNQAIAGKQQNQKHRQRNVFRSGHRTGPPIQA